MLSSLASKEHDSKRGPAPIPKGVYSLAGSLGLDIKTIPSHQLRDRIGECIKKINRVKVYKTERHCRCGKLYRSQFGFDYRDKTITRCIECIGEVHVGTTAYKAMSTFNRIIGEPGRVPLDEQLSCMRYFGVIRDPNEYDVLNEYCKLVDNDPSYESIKTTQVSQILYRIGEFLKFGNVWHDKGTGNEDGEDQHNETDGECDLTAD